jgi:hypothetical protein
VTAGFGTLFDAGLAAVAARRKRSETFGTEIGCASAVRPQRREESVAFEAMLGGIFDFRFLIFDLGTVSSRW